jgi:hypothetical protein
VSDFVEECRREWRRLGVPDPVANEMAADLTVDLEEAEAEGGSPEDVLGNSAFDPRRFAAAWAAARGVTSAPAPNRPPAWRTPIAIALAVVVGVLTIGAGLALAVGQSSSSVAFATQRVAAVPGSIRLFAPGNGRIVGPGLPPGIVATHISGIDVHPLALALILFIVGVLGLGLLAVWYWSLWSGRRRFRRDGGRRSPSWN